MADSIVSDLFYSLLIWTGGAIALAPCVATGLNWLEEKWQRLDDTRIVIRFDRQGR